jgi:hypothetical protein
VDAGFDAERGLVSRLHCHYWTSYDIFYITSNKNFSNLCQNVICTQILDHLRDTLVPGLRAKPLIG